MRWFCSNCETAALADGPDLIAAADTGRSDVWHFLRSWASNPLRVGAVAASGETLARLITREIGSDAGKVIELGPGTGVFTRALLANGVAEQDLTLIEYGEEFMPALTRRFPKARVMRMDASRLRKANVFEGQVAGAAVSGLPLLSMSPRKQTAILAGVFAYLRPGASLYQFTYGPRCPVPRRILDRLGLKAVRVGGTVRNIPPAAVYRISRRRPFDFSSGSE
ncbi:Phospholipid N-methyltransferase [Rhizobium sp. NFR07]|uniref:class I SAM-dependent methyltransferase n=1 Tax=Rhizobium sp. NFR07 TaxID=1566262 RepID=UPI0008DF6E64|nr:phospholipid methyltransferase [Rhizobium sp. NFR07]SFB43709.1 Phospholipid N-methyltransferase [Rhizobium sp. NFR07]